MNRERRKPRTLGVLTALFVVLILSLVGCEKGTLGLKGGSIAGTVLDSRTLVGVSGVSVKAVAGEEESMVTKYTHSDSNGNYHFSDMRADEWLLSFDKVGYRAIEADASNTIKVVVENSESSYVPEVRMTPTIANQYVTIRGTLKDATNGTLITYGNAQFIFGQEAFNNRLPTEFQTGFKVPASEGGMEMSINVAGYMPYTVTIPSGQTDRDMGSVLLTPESYKVTGRWTDVPGWVFQDNPTATVFAYAGDRIVATTTSELNSQSFTLTGIPKGTSVSILAEIKGYRMNGPIHVPASGDFQGTIYRTFSLKNNFSQIMRDVKVVISGNGISTNDVVGAYCNQTGTAWPQTAVSGTTIVGTNVPRVIDLGNNQVPTGYTLTFTGYVVDDGTLSSQEVFISDDGSDPQVVTLQVN